MFLKDKNNFAVGSADKLITARTINGTSFNGTANITTANWGTARTLTIGNTGKSVNGSANVSWSLSEIGAAPTSHTHNIHMTYGTCSTAAGTAEKVVSIVDSNWELKTGSVVMIKFTVTNTASNVKLNVNGTGAYPIWYNNAAYTGNSNQYCGYANRVTTYMFNGTHWVWISNSYDANSTYSNASLGQGYATCDTAQATAAKVATLSSYALTTGGIVSVKFTYAVPASATLNINSKGAKAIYYRGAAITANIIKAGDIATFIYNGSQYHLISIDRIDEKLDSTKTTECSTVNGISEFNCDNSGYIDNMVIEGKTEKLSDIVATTKTYTNLYKHITSSAVSTVEFDEYEVMPLAPEEDTLALTVEGCSTSYTGSVTVNIGGLVAGKTYTLGMELMFVGGFSGDWCGRLKVNSNSNGEVFNEYFDITSSEYRLLTFTPTGSSVALTFILSKNELDVYNIRIFEGNHIGKTKASFLALEGTTYSETVESNHRLVSVGQGDNIEVLTTPIHNNLIPQNYTKGEGYWTSLVDVGGVFSDSNWYRILEYIPVKPNTQYTGLYTGTQVVYYDENKNTIYHNQSDLVLGYEYYIFTTPQNAKYIRVSYPKNKEGNICIFEGVKHDKKQISTTLRSLPNGVKDTIEKRGNKYIKVQRCGEVTLNGSENWNWVSSFNDVIRYSYFIGGIAYKPSEINCNSDKFKAEKNELWNNNSEQIDVGNGDISINVMKNKLSNTSYTDSLNIKTWLASNPVTIVYELETPIITELQNFNPQTYKGKNTLIINSGVISCETNFEVNEGIRSELDETKDKLSNVNEILENNTLGYQKHKLTEDNGDLIPLENCDLNDIKEAGMYLAKGTTVLNRPTTDSNQYYVVEVFVGSQILQRATKDNGTSTFIRSYYAKEWTEWASIGGITELGRMTTANSPVLKSPAMVTMLATSKMTEGKPDRDGYITEYRWDNTGGYTGQFFVPNTNASNACLQFRGMSGGNWGNWQKVYSTGHPPTWDSISGGYSIGKDGVNFNDLRKSGEYYCINCTNTPTGTGNAWYLKVQARNTSYVYQYAVQNTSGNNTLPKYERTYYNGKWTAWRYL